MASAPLPYSSEPPPKTLQGSLLRQARLRPGAVALVDAQTGEETTWAAWAHEVRRLRGFLRTHGVEPGSIVVHVGRNHRLTWSLALATMDLGAHFWPANYRWTASELAAAIASLPSSPALSIVEGDFTDKITSFLPQFSRDALMIGPLDAHAGAATTSTGSLLVATGGTTGRPKIVSLTPTRDTSTPRGISTSSAVATT